MKSPRPSANIEEGFFSSWESEKEALIAILRSLCLQGIPDRFLAIFVLQAIGEGPILHSLERMEGVVRATKSFSAYPINIQALGLAKKFWTSIEPLFCIIKKKKEK